MFVPAKVPPATSPRFVTTRSDASLPVLVHRRRRGVRHREGLPRFEPDGHVRGREAPPDSVFREAGDGPAADVDRLADEIVVRVRPGGWPDRHPRHPERVEAPVLVQPGGPGEQVRVPDRSHRIPAQVVHRYEDVRRSAYDSKAVSLRLGHVIVVAAIAEDDAVPHALEPDAFLLRRRGAIVEAHVALDDEVVDRLQVYPV